VARVVYATKIVVNVVPVLTVEALPMVTVLPVADGVVTHLSRRVLPWLQVLDDIPSLSLLEWTNFESREVQGFAAKVFRWGRSCRQ
jgi:hypothetical protein